MVVELTSLRAIATNVGNWSVKVQILAKMNPRVALNSPTTYQKLLLGDEMGDCMEVVIFNSDVDIFQHSLRVGGTYIISNAKVNINKAQGQTLERAGIYLPEPVFSHGQLYVVLSRVRNSHGIKVLIRPPTVDTTIMCETRNIVYIEILEEASRESDDTI